MEKITGQIIAGSYAPFIEMSGIAEKLAQAIDNAISATVKAEKEKWVIVNDWKEKGKFTYKGLTYRKGINEYSAELILKSIE